MGVQKIRGDLFLIAIDQLRGGSGSEPARTGRIAKRLGIADGIASTKLKQLAKDGLIVYQPYVGTTLTESGCNRLSEVLRRLRLIEIWLSTSLNLEREFLSEDALRMEAVASDRLVKAIESAVGCFAFDRADESRIARS